jgi:hypothetical protein
MGYEQGWPGTLPDGTLLVTKAKGIYKPSWTKYALSIRQSLGGPYPDHEPEMKADGTWSYVYHQENRDPTERDSEYTNIGLLECIKDSVPVGVIYQVKKKPAPRYQVLGVALVTRWNQGYFYLAGFSRNGTLTR